MSCQRYSQKVVIYIVESCENTEDEKKLISVLDEIAESYKEERIG